MNSITNVLSVLFLTTCFIQCDSQKTNNSPKKQQIVYNVTSDIPLDGRGEKRLVYMAMRQMESKLNLSDLSKGFDSIQIRIWCTYSFYNKGQLISLTHENNKWTANLCVYEFLEKKDGQIDTVAKWKNGVPKSGWNLFISKLLELEVLTLPDLDKINKTIVISDGDAVTVEFGTKTKYRVYQFVDPSDFQDKWREAKQMENILLLIESEFNFKRLRMPQDSRE